MSEPLKALESIALMPGRTQTLFLRASAESGWSFAYGSREEARSGDGKALVAVQMASLKCFKNFIVNGKTKETVIEISIKNSG